MGPSRPPPAAAPPLAQRMPHPQQGGRSQPRGRGQEGRGGRGGGGRGRGGPPGAWGGQQDGGGGAEMGGGAKRQKRDKGSVAPEVMDSSGPVVVRAPATEEERLEVERWKEERRKHFPTSANVVRKAAEAAARREAGGLDPRAEERRQRLREVLERQAAMGLDKVAGTTDLIDSLRASGRGGRGMSNAGPGAGRNGGRGRGSFTWSRDAAAADQGGAAADGATGQAEAGARDGGAQHGWQQQQAQQQHQQRPPQKRKASLLEKLLANEIRRDHSWLLQCTRFLCRNHFLQQLGSQPLVFPAGIPDVPCTLADVLPPPVHEDDGVEGEEAELPPPAAVADGPLPGVSVKEAAAAEVTLPATPPVDAPGVMADMERGEEL